MRPRPPVARRAVCLCLAAAGLAVLAGVLVVTAAGVVTAGGPGTLEDAVVALAAAAAALVAGWLALGIVVSVAGLLAGWPERLLPRHLHRLVALGLGVALAGVSVPPSAQAAALRPAVAVTAATDGTSAPEPRAPLDTAAAGGAVLLPAEAVDPSWTPPPPPPTVRRATPADPLVVPAPRADPQAQDAVAVRRGDTLWDIAARHLPAGALDADIAAAWPRWHAANATVIGDDPDLLLPGQLLRVPTDAG